jgi:hypothetical protein
VTPAHHSRFSRGFGGRPGLRSGSPSNFRRYAATPAPPARRLMASFSSGVTGNRMSTVAAMCSFFRFGMGRNDSYGILPHKVSAVVTNCGDNSIAQPGNGSYNTDMRVWIISDKRYGDSEEEHWVAEICHDPAPDSDPDEAVWDRVEYRGRRCKSEAEAVKVATSLKSNVMNSAQVFKRALERVDRDRYDWSVVSTPQEVECIYESSP